MTFGASDHKLTALVCLNHDGKPDSETHHADARAGRRFEEIAAPISRSSPALRLHAILPYANGVDSEAPHVIRRH